MCAKLKLSCVVILCGIAQGFATLEQEHPEIDISDDCMALLSALVIAIIGPILLLVVLKVT